MTTITNFLHSNFSDINKSNTKQHYQVPIWVIKSCRAKKTTILKQYIIDNCLHNNKPIVHLDIGICSLKSVKGCDLTRKINICQGLDLFALYKEKPYFLLLASSQLRQNVPQFHNIIIKTLNNLPSFISNFKDQSSTVGNKGFSLLIQGLQIVSTQKKLASNLETLINHLSSLNEIYKQISIFKNENILLPQHQFSLQRISTCITQIQKYDSVKLQWIVKSTVRRYTGFSNQQKYLIRLLKNDKLKVQKWVPTIQQGQTESQKHMLSDLGFVVKKKEAAHEQNIKQMIYPHLRVQNEAKNICKNHQKQKKCKNCQHQQIRPEDQGLIILDDEQEDDDDIDV